jgi:hypothetical protein
MSSARAETFNEIHCSRTAARFSSRSLPADSFSDFPRSGCMNSARSQATRAFVINPRGTLISSENLASLSLACKF